MAKEKIDKGIAQRIRDTILEKNISITELAAEMDTSNALIYYWMNGERNPSLASLIKLCEALDVSSDWLIFGKASNDNTL